MSITASPEPRRSPKRKRDEDTPDAGAIPQYDGAADGAALQFAYDEEMPSELQTPDDEQEHEAKRPRIERPTRLNYVPYLTLRGHKRGVAAVKFSPDGRWIASCCKPAAASTCASRS
jgi:COMPASS component SWD3